MSAFMNTTPIVAMYLPMVSDWAKRLRIQPSKLFMPLSFSGILGGQGSMIGTGSNLIIIVLFITWWKEPPTWVADLNIGPPSGALVFWGAAWIGIPVAIIGMIFIVLTSKWLLPNRTPAIESKHDHRLYEIKMQIEKDSPIIGKSIEQAELRGLDGLYLSAIVRDDQIIHAVTPEVILFNGDKLLFVGDIESVVDLRKIGGIVPAAKELNDIDGGLLLEQWLKQSLLEARRSLGKV